MQSAQIAHPTLENYDAARAALTAEEARCLTNFRPKAVAAYATAAADLLIQKITVGVQQVMEQAPSADREQVFGALLGPACFDANLPRAYPQPWRAAAVSSVLAAAQHAFVASVTPTATPA